MNGKWKLASSSIGIAAYMLTDILHEVAGHGGASLLVGNNKVELISSVYFKSSPGSFFTDLGGPIANLLAGLLIYIFLKQRKNLSLLFAIFLLNLMAYNLCWFSGTIVQSGVSKIGDWTYAIKELHLGTWGNAMLLVAGVISYWLSIKTIRLIISNTSFVMGGFPLKQSVMYAYMAATVAAIIAGLFFKNDYLHAAFEGLLEMLGLLPIIFIIPNRQISENNYHPEANPIVTVLVFILLIAFCFTLGHGIS